jgi:hypothetical protein
VRGQERLRRAHRPGHPQRHRRLLISPNPELGSAPRASPAGREITYWDGQQLSGGQIRRGRSPGGRC